MTRTVKDLLKEATTHLRGAGVTDPAGDARRLMAFVLGGGADRVLMLSGTTLTAQQTTAWLTVLRDRCARRPVAQITGRRLFWTLEFDVTADVLDPRPETETLIEQALNHDFTRLLDLGCGSGCIALSLLSERPETTALAVDVSAAALKVAIGNARQLGLADRITFNQSDWFSDVAGTFDLIVSNPPYIRQADFTTLSPDVRCFEPKIALVAGSDGLDAYRRIAKNLTRHLRPDGRALFEIGPDQARDVTAVFADVGLTLHAIHRDLDNRDRVVEFIYVS